MDLYQLSYFKTLAAMGSFSKAAEGLDLSQPALSRSILRLEGELGVPLFDRKSRGVSLNRYGEIFLKSTNEALAAINQAKQEINHLVDPFQGTIYLAFIHPLGSNFIPDLISEFQRDYPKIRFKLTVATTYQILEQLDSGLIDIGFCTHQQHLDNIHSMHIMTKDLLLIVPKDHRLADQEEVELSEVANEPFVFYKPETALHDVILEFCHEAGFQPIISVEAFEEMTAAGLVSAKLGVSMVPDSAGLDTEKVSSIPISKPRCSMVIQVVFRTKGYISPAVRYFQKYIEKKKWEEV